MALSMEIYWRCWHGAGREVFFMWRILRVAAYAPLLSTATPFPSELPAHAH